MPFALTVHPNIMPASVPRVESPSPFDAVLPRIQFIELHESEWVPDTFRHAMTEMLYVLGRSLRVHETVLPILERVLDASGENRIVDLCSGAGGPVVALQNAFASRGRPVSVLLTDAFPNLPAYRLAEERSAGFIRGHPEPVDAARIPAELKGVRTLFSAFHHFPPHQARSILEDAYLRRQPLAIFETTERTLFNTLTNFPLSFVTVLALMPTMRAKRPEWWPFTYLLPILPTIFAWDSVVSCLRSYTPLEFRQLTTGLHDDVYRWSSGRVRVPKSPIHVNYHIGFEGNPG